MPYHGITNAEWRDAGSSGAFTAITALGSESGVEFDDPEGVQPPAGGKYYGGRRSTATVQHVDPTQHAALEVKYKANLRIELKLTLTGGDIQTVTGLCQAVPESIKGAAGGARGYMLTVVGFAV